MAAGLSQKQVYRRVYNRLQSLKSSLEKAGVFTIYEHSQLIHFEGNGESIPHSDVDGGFNIKFSVSRASNGEVAGFPRVLVIYKGETEHYGWAETNGSFEQGIERVKSLFRRGQ